jgi:hypothetical protein
MKPYRRIFLASSMVLGMALLLWAGGGPGQAVAADEPETFPCVAESGLKQEIAPEASLEEFVCFLKSWKGAETLHFKVRLKNVSDQPQRFRVNIFLDNGKAVGGLIPRKTKGGLVEPGASAEFAYPVKGMTEKPCSLFLRIMTMNP